MNKSQLLAQFSTYLDMNTEQDNHKKDVDLFRLFSELAGLKSEVKRESKQVKQALDEFRQVFTVLETSNNQLTSELQKQQNDHQVAIDHALKGLLLKVIDISDRLEEGIEATKKHKSSFWSKLWRRAETIEDASLVKQSLQGQEMTVRRIAQLLASYQVQPMAVLNKMLDPHCMQAIEVEDNPDQASGIVIREQRKGFYYQGEVLRHAEVVANK